MGPMVFGCVLCGFGILEAGPEQWLREYRVVYRDNTGHYVTGVGEYDGRATWTMPADPSLRWNTRSDTDRMIEIPVMRQHAKDGVHGFVLHAACWDVLLEAGKHRALQINRLVSICESLPISLWTNTVNWGHDYEGLLKADVGDACPWFERFHHRSVREIHDMGAMKDPSKEPELSGQSIDADCRPEAAPGPVSGESHDCFSRLPWELLEIISVSLPTNDALQLRLASRSFVPLFQSFAFWQSRFEPDGDRGFLFEQDRGASSRAWEDLLRIYRLSRLSAASSELKNRKRVWNLARRLTSLTIVSFVGDDITGRRTNSLKQLSIAGLQQPLVTPEEWSFFHEGFRPGATVYMNISSRTVKLGITLASMGCWDYVTGIRIISQDGSEQTAGYVSKEHEQVRDMTAAEGIRVAMGPAGLRALQVISQGEHSSEWMGRPEQVPRSDRLASMIPMATMSVTFDNFKITALAVAMNKEHQTSPGLERGLTIRGFALWYPDFPPKGVRLNEETFAGEHHTDGYKPLSWNYFGGQAGRDLIRLQGVSAQVSGGIHGLQFVLSESDGTTYFSKLGRCTERSLASGPTFPVDGAGGERINSLTVGIYRYQETDWSRTFQRTILRFITIKTNRGRMEMIGAETDDLEIKTITASPGTTITGLYGHHDAVVGLASLGVISEPESRLSSLASWSNSE